MGLDTSWPVIKHDDSRRRLRAPTIIREENDVRSWILGFAGALAFAAAGSTAGAEQPKRGGNLPPGLEKHIQRNGQLPPGLQKRVEPFPQDLVSQLPRIPERIRRVILGRRALMLDGNTILDELALD